FGTIDDTPMAASHGHPVQSVDELVAHFTAGAKPLAARRIGMEHEKVGVLPDGSAPGYGTILKILESLAEQGVWERIEERNKLIALRRLGGGTVTLEPGGQVERSGAPYSTAAEAVAENDAHIDELIPIAAAHG